MSISIELNGEPYEAAEESTVAGLVSVLGLADKRIAVEYNLEILPRSLHAQTRIQSGDRVEIVHAIGGG